MAERPGLVNKLRLCAFQKPQPQTYKLPKNGLVIVCGVQMILRIIAHYCP